MNMFKYERILKFMKPKLFMVQEVKCLCQGHTVLLGVCWILEPHFWFWALSIGRVDRSKLFGAQGKSLGLQTQFEDKEKRI